MTGLDTAIRKAIDRADARDPDARERVYRSAREALERSLARRPGLDDAAMDQQRRRFDELIREIESEKAAEEGSPGALSDMASPVAPEAAGPVTAGPPDPSAANSGKPDPAEIWRPAEAGSGPDPDIRGEERRNVAGVSVSGDAEAGPSGGAHSSGIFDGLADEVRAERRATKKQRKKAAAAKRKERRARRPRTAARVMSALFLIVSAVVFGSLVIWFLNVAGFLDSAGSVGGGASSFRKFDAVSSGATPNLMTENSFGGAWSPIFVPGKSGSVTPGPNARTEKVTDERGKALRLTSTTPDAAGDVRIEVPAVLMDRMAGKTSVLALNVRAVRGKPTQIAIECAFSSLGGCRRRRFDVAAEMTDVVMKLRFRKGTPPHKPGHLLLNTDIGGGGRSIDLFAVGLRGAD